MITPSIINNQSETTIKKMPRHNQYTAKNKYQQSVKELKDEIKALQSDLKNTEQKLKSETNDFTANQLKDNTLRIRVKLRMKQILLGERWDNVTKRNKDW